MSIHCPSLRQVEIHIFTYALDQSKQRLDDEKVKAFLQIQRELIAAERNMVKERRREGNISADVLRRIDYELDLEETGLIMELEST